METKHSNRARSRKGALRGAVLAGALMALVGCQSNDFVKHRRNQHAAAIDP